MTWFRCGIKNNSTEELNKLLNKTIERINIFNTTSVNGSLCTNCANLKYVELGSIVDTINSYAFYGCNALENFVMRHNGVVSFGTSAFLSSSIQTQVGCNVYVPQAQINSYLSDASWSNFFDETTHPNNHLIAIEGSPYEEV